MASVTYGKCYLWQKYYGKCNYGKSIMANETEPLVPLSVPKHVEDRFGFCKRLFHQTSEDSKQVFVSYMSPSELLHPPNPKSYVIWTNTVIYHIMFQFQISTLRKGVCRWFLGHDLFWPNKPQQPILTWNITVLTSLRQMCFKYWKNAFRGFKFNLTCLS